MNDIEADVFKKRDNNKTSGLIRIDCVDGYSKPKRLDPRIKSVRV